MTRDTATQELIILSKVPTPGKTKTRLMPRLSPQQCADFHYACLADLAKLSQQLKQKTRICYAGEPCSEFCSLFPIGTDFSPQQGPDLGHRMAHAFKQALLGNRLAVLIGADLPHLPLAIIEQAFSVAAAYDVVLGPAWDGGYYLIGMKRLIPELFIDIEWGSSQVLAQTLKILDHLQLSYFLLEYLNDLDTPEDLQVFMNNPQYRDLQAWQYLHHSLK